MAKLSSGGSIRDPDDDDLRDTDLHSRTGDRSHPNMAAQPASFTEIPQHLNSSALPFLPSTSTYFHSNTDEQLIRNLQQTGRTHLEQTNSGESFGDFPSYHSRAGIMSHGMLQSLPLPTAVSLNTIGSNNDPRFTMDHEAPPFRTHYSEMAVNSNWPYNTANAQTSYERVRNSQPFTWYQQMTPLESNYLLDFPNLQISDDVDPLSQSHASDPFGLSNSASSFGVGLNELVTKIIEDDGSTVCDDSLNGLSASNVFAFNRSSEKPNFVNSEWSMHGDQYIQTQPFPVVSNEYPQFVDMARNTNAMHCQQIDSGSSHDDAAFQQYFDQTMKQGSVRYNPGNYSSQTINPGFGDIRQDSHMSLQNRANAYAMQTGDQPTVSHLYFEAQQKRNAEEMSVFKSVPSQTPFQPAHYNDSVLRNIAESQSGGSQLGKEDYSENVNKTGPGFSKWQESYFNPIQSDPYFQSQQQFVPVDHNSTKLQSSPNARQRSSTNMPPANQRSAYEPVDQFRVPNAVSHDFRDNFSAASDNYGRNLPPSSLPQQLLPNLSQISYLPLNLQQELLRKFLAYELLPHSIMDSNRFVQSRGASPAPDPHLLGRMSQTPVFCLPTNRPLTPFSLQSPQQSYPGGRFPRGRSGPATELHIRLEECYEQFRSIENERKRTEAELARQNPGKMISSTNNIPTPHLSVNPSRIDRLVVELFREHANVITLIKKMEHIRNDPIPVSIHSHLSLWMGSIQKLQSCRRDEIINASNRHISPNPQTQKEKDILALASAMNELSFHTQNARTSLWCSLQLASRDLPKQCIRSAEHTARRFVCDLTLAQCQEEEEKLQN